MLGKLFGRGRHADKQAERKPKGKAKSKVDRPTGWHTFTWETDTRAGLQIEQTIAQYGIPCRARKMQTSDALDVPNAQAVYAEYILCCAGVALTSPLLEPRNLEWATARGGSMPPPRGDGLSSKRIDTMGRIVRWADTLLSGSANKRAAGEFVRSRARSTKRRR